MSVEVMPKLVAPSSITPRGKLGFDIFPNRQAVVCNTAQEDDSDRDIISPTSFGVRVHEKLPGRAGGDHGEIAIGIRGLTPEGDSWIDPPVEIWAMRNAKETQWRPIILTTCARRIWPIAELDCAR